MLFGPNGHANQAENCRWFWGSRRGVWSAYAVFNTAADLPKDATALARMLADPPIYLPWLILLGALAVFAWSMWPRKNEAPADTSSGISQLSSGSHAANLAGNFHGPVHINPPPAPVQERKLAVGWTHRSVGGLERVTTGTPAPKPDMLLAGLLVRVYKKLGRPNSKSTDFVRCVNLEIADTVAMHHLHVWGRINSRPLDLIPEDYWRRGELDHRANSFTVIFQSAIVYTDLRFNRSEIDAHWKPEDNTDGQS